MQAAAKKTPSRRKRNPASRSEVIVIDPLGNLVLFSPDRWDNHILPRHPEMTGRWEQAMETVRNPMRITLRPGRWISAYAYYRLSPGIFIRVIADIDRNQAGKLTLGTAYGVMEFSAKEEILWEK